MERRKKCFNFEICLFLSISLSLDILVLKDEEYNDEDYADENEGLPILKKYY